MAARAGRSSAEVRSSAPERRHIWREGPIDPRPYVLVQSDHREVAPMAEDTEEEKQEFNVLNHELVPIHELLSEEEQRRLFEVYNIIPEQLPKILASDPAAMAVGA